MKISKKFLDFFKRTSTERIIFLRGGRRSGKTFAIFYKFAHNFEKGSGGDVLVTAPSHSSLGTLMNDFSEVYSPFSFSVTHFMTYHLPFITYHSTPITDSYP